MKEASDENIIYLKNIIDCPYVTPFTQIVTKELIDIDNDVISKVGELFKDMKNNLKDFWSFIFIFI